jgi:hypothetical protein
VARSCFDDKTDFASVTPVAGLRAAMVSVAIAAAGFVAPLVAGQASKSAPRVVGPVTGAVRASRLSARLWVSNCQFPR